MAAPRLAAAVALGRELRRLRLERGLSQRALTRLLGLSAHSNIADYETGRRIPPRDIVTDCDRVLAADGALTAHLHLALAERAALGGSALSSPAAAAALALPSASASNAAAPSTPGTAVPVSLRDDPVPHACAPGAPASISRFQGNRGISAKGSRDIPEIAKTSRQRRQAGRLIAVALVAAAMLSWSAPQRGDPSIWDGNDPKAAGCADDATSVDAQPVHLFPHGRQIGTVHLRYSPGCQAAWAKFEPMPATTESRSVMVIVEAVRPADGMKTTFHFPALQQIYGDLLRTGPGCVQATAIVQITGEVEITGSTACLSPTAG